MTDKTTKPRDPSRRDFLRNSATAVGAAGAAAVALATGSAEAAEPAVGADGSVGYHETDHIRTYYELARF